MTNPGGMATAIVLRKRALENYYLSPKICLHCQQIIKVAEGEKVQAVRRKQCCSKRCANEIRRRTKLDSDGMVSVECNKCAEQFLYKWKKGSIRRFCSTCAFEKRGSHRKLDDFSAASKEEVFQKFSSWQSARTAIRRHAVQVYKQSGRPFSCRMCGYGAHVQIAHIMAVAAFPGSAKLSQINAAENLVALCPNHHWEYDNGVLGINSIILR